MQNNKDEVRYIHFGPITKILTSGAITCGGKITTNIGVSVFNAYYNEGKWQPVLPVPCRKGTADTINRFMSQSPQFHDPVFLVTGDKIGTGFDGEPLINNVKIIKDITNQFGCVYDTQSIDGVSINLWLGDDIVSRIKDYVGKNHVTSSDIYRFIASRILLHENKNFGVIDLKTLPKNSRCPLKRTLNGETKEIRTVDFIFLMEALNSQRIRYIRGLGPVTYEQLNQIYNELLNENNYEELIAEIYEFFKTITNIMSQKEVYPIISLFKKRYGYE